MNPSAGLRTALNAIREMSVQDGSIYHRYIPEIIDGMTVGEFGAPMLDNTTIASEIRNDFIGLLKRIVGTMIDSRVYQNPLAQLEGERLPLGTFVQDINVQPVEGRQFNVNDFAGLLQKYEADVRVQYHAINADLQYPVTITRAKLKDAFMSWTALEQFVNGITNSLYNSAYIDMYNYTKALVVDAYLSNKVQVKVVDAVTDKESAEALTEELRGLYLDFAFPRTDFNAWKKLDPEKRPLNTFVNVEDIVVLIPTSVRKKLDVQVLANAFNISEADLLGRIITVDDFIVRNVKGKTGLDGSAIQAIICDKAWFKIRTQEMEMDEFYNANNRTWQMYLNVTKMYNYSLFADAVVLATEAPTVDATAVKASPDTVTLGVGAKATSNVTLTPINATSEITVTSSNSTVATATVEDGVVTITGVATGTATITVTANSITDTIAVTVE